MGPGRVIAVIATLFALVFARPVEAQSLEYAVKANYLVRFAAFVDWPGAAFVTSDAPLVICVVGRDPFGPALERAAAAQTAHGRRLAVRRPAGPAALSGCHIAYLGEGTADASIDRLEGLPGVLVVSDERVSDRRGAIHFILLDNRVRFRIDQAVAGRAGLAISSRLLNLAVSVTGRG